MTRRVFTKTRDIEGDIGKNKETKKQQNCTWYQSWSWILNGIYYSKRGRRLEGYNVPCLSTSRSTNIRCKLAVDSRVTTAWRWAASGIWGGAGMTRWELKAERRLFMFDRLSQSCKECVDYCNLRRSWGADLSCLTGHHGPGMTEQSSRDEKDCLHSTPICTCELFLNPPQPVTGQVPQAQVNQTSTKPSSKLPLQWRIRELRKLWQMFIYF